MRNFTLHLENEASCWENATPVGCGTLGGMLYGGVFREQLQLNEERLWDEGTKTPIFDGFYERFHTLRDVLLRGECGDELAKEILTSHFTRIGSYETAGDLYLTLSHATGDVTEYRRDLDLLNGIATVSYRLDGNAFRRTLFCFLSAKDDRASL